MDLIARQNAMKMLSSAVQRWYRHYSDEHDERTSDVLCQATIALFEQGHRSEDEIVTLLIGSYVGLDSTRVNAPTSSSVH